MLPHGFNRKLGYYKVGNDEYEYAMQAMMASSELDKFAEFDFNNEEFAKIKWSIEPNETLQDCYVERAKQLREKYDYLILAYSGGSDSWNILNTFLTAGIKLDEIVTYYPKKATNNLTIDEHKFDYLNVWQEYYLTVEKDLQHLATHHPEIKITISDWSDRTGFSLKDGWQEKSGSTMIGTSAEKYYPPNLTDSIYKFKNIGWIVGLEKPRICYRDYKFYIYFLDFVTHLSWDSGSCVDGGFWTPELFYWAPEAEKIRRKQAHTIKKFYQKNPQLLFYITWPLSPKYAPTYEFLIKPLIYPEWDMSRWQADKPIAGQMFMGYETVLWNHFPELAREFYGSKKEALHAIDKKYLHDEERVKSFISKFYEI